MSNASMSYVHGASARQSVSLSLLHPLTAALSFRQSTDFRYKATTMVPSITQTLLVIFFHTDMNIETFKTKNQYFFHKLKPIYNL